jgi:hypothetical protein
MNCLQAGFEIVDVAGGYELRPKKPYITLAYPRDIRPIDLEKDVTVGLIVDGFHRGCFRNCKDDQGQQ